jgi:chromate transporter
MESDVVRRRRWLTPEELLDMMGATNLIPGPNSTEMAIHIGYQRAGLAGVLMAGSAFILPAALLALGLAWAYVRFGALPQMTAFFYGAKPAIITVVAQALWRLGRAAVRSRLLAAAALVALTAAAAGVDELVVLFATPALVAGVQLGSRARAREEKTRRIFTTATFIGYVLGGVKGALLATIGIFLPAFFFVVVSAPLVPRLRAS